MKKKVNFMRHLRDRYELKSYLHTLDKKITHNHVMVLERSNELETFPFVLIPLKLIKLPMQKYIYIYINIKKV